MSLETCADCQHPVSSEAVACPACGRPMRDRSYLTPWGWMVLGGLFLVACFAWPPLIAVLLTVVFFRFLARARRGSVLRLTVAAAAVGTSCLLAMGIFPDYACVVLAIAMATLIWLASARFGPSTQSGFPARDFPSGSDSSR